MLLDARRVFAASSFATVLVNLGSVEGLDVGHDCSDLVELLVCIAIGTGGSSKWSARRFRLCRLQNNGFTCDPHENTDESHERWSGVA
jgi:hypothetical protein